MSDTAGGGDQRFAGVDEHRGGIYRFDPDTIVHRTPDHPVRDGVEVMSTAFHADPLDHYRWMQTHAPVYWDDVTGLWALTKHQDISHVEANHEVYCSVRGSRPESSVPS